METAAPPRPPRLGLDGWLAGGAVIAGIVAVGIGVVLLLRGDEPPPTNPTPSSGVARYVPEDWEPPAGLDPTAGRAAPPVVEDDASPITPARLDGAPSSVDEWSEPHEHEAVAGPGDGEGLADLADMPTAAAAPEANDTPTWSEGEIAGEPGAASVAEVPGAEPPGPGVPVVEAPHRAGPAVVADVPASERPAVPSSGAGVRDAQGTPGAPDVPGVPPTTPLPGPPHVEAPIVSDPPTAPVVVGDHPGRRLAVSLQLEAPSALRQGGAAEVVLVVRNDGEVRLEDLELGLRSRDGVRVADSVDGLWTGRVALLAPGATERVSVGIIADTPGAAQLLASCREPRGWAAAGATNRVDVLGRAEPVATARSATRAGPALALRLASRGPERVEAEQPFELVLTLQNTGDVHFRGVVLVLEPAAGVRLRGQDKRIEERLPELAAGASHTLRVIVKPEQPGLRILRASARDERGWAATGVVHFLGVDPVVPPDMR